MSKEIFKGFDFYVQGRLFTITDTIGDSIIMALAKPEQDQERLFQVDDKVLYMPIHAHGDKEHPDCQRGTVSSVGKLLSDGSQQSVWVRYTEGETGALTPTKNLVLISAAEEIGVKTVSQKIDEFIAGCGGNARDAVNVALTKLDLKEQIINHLNECVAALEEKVKVIEAKVDAQEWLKYFDDTVEEFGVAHMVTKKQNMQEIRRQLGDTDEIDEYDGGDIWIERREAPTVTEFPGVRGTLLTDQTHPASGIRTNVQRLEYKHSPTGFNFGYGGSGPADLALNICLMFCNQGRDAYRIYQEFKRTFLCVGQTDRLEIRRGEIENFLLIQGAELNPNI